MSPYKAAGLSLALVILAGPALAQEPVRRQGGVCPQSYTGSGGYCIPNSEKAKRAIPRRKGEPCPYGYSPSGDACLSVK